MGLTRALVILTMASGAVLSGAHSALACSCHGGGPVCQDFWTAPVVFIGRVEAVTALPHPDPYDQSETVRFRVLEVLRGDPARTVDLHNLSNSCHFRFKPGQEWVIYAFSGRDDGTRLSTSVCSRTAPLREALQDVAYGRAARLRKADRGRIYGRLTYADRRGLVAVPGVRITIDGGRSESISTLTDEQGLYEVLAPAGTYRLTAALPAGMTISADQTSIELPDNRACVFSDLWADYPGEMTGRVLDASSRPVPNLTVELINAEAWDFAPYRLRGITDHSGRYVIAGVEPGSYAPGVLIGSMPTGIETEPVFIFGGHTTTKSSARRVEVEGGRRREAGDVVLPKTARIAHISGIVVHPDGRPAARAKVRTKAAIDAWSFPWTTIRTDSSGAFSFALVAGLRYRLVAEPLRGTGKNAEQTLDTAQPVPTLRLVVE